MSSVGLNAFNNYDRQAEIAGAGGGRGTAFVRPRDQGDAPAPMLERMTSRRTAEGTIDKETKIVCSNRVFHRGTDLANAPM